LDHRPVNVRISCRWDIDEAPPALSEAEAKRIESPVSRRIRVIQTMSRELPVETYEMTVDLQSFGSGALEHPMEGDVRQPVVDIAASDVRMDAGEPALLHHLPWSCSRPDFWSEVVSPFVDCKRLSRMVDAFCWNRSSIKGSPGRRCTCARRSESRPERHD